MRNELLDLYNEAIASNATKDAVYAYREARDRIGPQIVMEEVLDNDALRARLAEVEARHKKLEVALQKIEDKDSYTRRGLWTYGPFGKIAREALVKLEAHDGK